MPNWVYLFIYLLAGCAGVYYHKFHFLFLTLVSFWNGRGKKKSVEDILHVLIIFCLECLESDRVLLFSERHTLLRVLPVLVVLATSGEKEGESIFKKIKIPRLLSIFKVRIFMHYLHPFFFRFFKNSLNFAWLLWKSVNLDFSSIGCKFSVFLRQFYDIAKVAILDKLI